jgi:ATP-dependent exoDNAse (exonuclease V) beta subunit
MNPDQTVLLDESPSIPGGAQTGNVLHGIFEHLDFQSVKAHSNLAEFQQDQSVINVIESQMKAFLMADGEILDAVGQLRSTYRNEFAAWVWHTLRKPIDVLGGMPLCELSDTNRRHEMSFYWSHSGHVLTGFIDLLFKVAGPEGDRYYILDWKSNYNAGGYAPKALSEQVMQAHNYHDQYRWYTLAIKSWFNSLKLENASLAGALYVFSRGIDSQTADQNGVFYQDLTTDAYRLDHLEQQLISQIKSTHAVIRGAS